MQFAIANATPKITKEHVVINLYDGNNFVVYSKASERFW